MRPEDLEKIAHYVRLKTRALVPYSSNRPSLNNQPFHRMFWLDAMRAQNDPYGDRQRLKKWRMNISDNRVSNHYPDRKVTQTFFGAQTHHPTLQEWDDYLLSLPQRSNKMNHKNGNAVTEIELFESTAKNAVSFGIGNCGEMSATAFTLLLEYPKSGIAGLPPITDDIMVESVWIEGKGDHAFLVLNRNVNSTLTDLSTWGPDAIILDPWMNAVVNVSNELKSSASHCFQYIHYYQSNLKTDHDQFCYIGDCHSRRWRDKRYSKSEPYYLRDWRPVVNDGANVPWAKDYDAEFKVTPKLK